MKRVLLVISANIEKQTNFVLICKALGFELVQALNLAAARVELDKFPPDLPPDLIFWDMVFADGSDATKLIEATRAKFQQVPMVANAGLDAYRMRQQRAGCDHKLDPATTNESVQEFITAIFTAQALALAESESSQPVTP